MAALFNYYYRVDLTVIQASGYPPAISTKTYSFVNKQPRSASTQASYFPILRAIGEVSLLATETLPSVTPGTIEIDNSIGSFGANRKFSDVLQRWSPIEQEISVFVGVTAINSDAAPSSWDTIFTGKVSSWEASSNADGGSLVFSISPITFSDMVLTLEVSRTVSGMTNAPLSSIGRAVPLLIGEGFEVLPVRISADLDESPVYAWGTCLYQHLKNVSTSYKLYTKNYADVWEWVVSGNTDYSGSTSSGSYTLNTYDARAFKLDVTAPTVVTGIELRAKGNGTGGRVSTAYLTVSILRVDATTYNVVEDPMSKARVALTNYDTSNNAGTTNFAIKVAFDEPIVLSLYESSAYSYYVAWEVENYAVNELSLHYGSGTSTELRKDAAFDSANEWRVIGSGNFILYKLHEISVSMTDHENSYTSSGLTYSSMTITQTAVDSSQANPSLDNMQFLLSNVQGLSAYSGGAVQDTPLKVVSALGYTWSGTAWSNANLWDATTLEDHYETLYEGSTPNFRSRGVTGFYEGKVTFRDLLADMCRSTASKVGVATGLNSGQSYLYPWGYTVTSPQHIPAADIASLSWQQRDTSTVINRATINVYRSYLFGASQNGTGGGPGYRYSTDYSAQNYGQVTAMTLESLTLYGNKELANPNFPLWPLAGFGSNSYLGTGDIAGSILGEYYLARFSKPLVYCSFVVPYHRYSTLKMFDVITFASPNFPAYYGTDPEARDGVVDVSGAVTPVDANYSAELVRAQTYRGQIEGVSYVLAMEHAPAIRLLVLVLLNQQFDPT